MSRPNRLSSLLRRQRTLLLITSPSFTPGSIWSEALRVSSYQLAYTTYTHSGKTPRLSPVVVSKKADRGPSHPFLHSPSVHLPTPHHQTQIPIESKTPRASTDTGTYLHLEPITLHLIASYLTYRPPILYLLPLFHSILTLCFLSCHIQWPPLPASTPSPSLDKNLRVRAPG